MNIDEIVYILQEVFIFNNKVPNAVQILPVRIAEIHKATIAVEILCEDNKSIFKEIGKNDYHKNIHDAMKAIEPFVNKKVKFLREDEVNQDIPTMEELNSAK